ncbi:CoA-binding protein [Pendulispora brunnea]|uniref:CoA-binding protein n=1 Tax=Pendulispora brunnea TaxID=2905690 RepID=A0ABZ2K3I5_9BACT
MADNQKMREVFDTSGFVVEHSSNDNIYRVVFPTRKTEDFIAASLARERQAAAHSVNVFFEPESIAVVGASRHEGSIGRVILSNLKRCEFRGPVYPVNPHVPELEGFQCYPSVGAIGRRVDLAVVAVPQTSVRDVVAECARAGVRGIVVITSGFAEAWSDGRNAQDELCRFARASGMRMVGPNCMGILCTAPGVSMNATFAPVWPPSGGVSMLSQSGALGLAMLDHAAQRNIGIASFVSVGNKADVSGNDLIAYWADDPHTTVIALYLESFGNPRKFARLAPEVAKREPIVALKSGRSGAGTRAAASHSAALASVDAGVDAVLAQAGVIRTNTMEELSTSSRSSRENRCRGGRVSVW